MKVRIVSILRKYPDLTLLYLSQFWGAEKRIILEVVHKIVSQRGDKFRERKI